MRAVTLAIMAIMVFPVSACQTREVAIKPCGVIDDGLKDVRGAKPADTQRIDVHYERGRAAGCWQ